MGKIRSEWEYLNVWFKAFELMALRDKQVRAAQEHGGARNDLRPGPKLSDLDFKIDLSLGEVRSLRDAAMKESEYVSARKARNANLTDEEEMILLYLLYQKVKPGGAKLSPTEIVPVLFYKRKNKLACYQAFGSDSKLIQAGLIERVGMDYVCSEWFAARMFSVGGTSSPSRSALAELSQNLTYSNYLRALTELSELMQKRAKILFRSKSHSYKVLQMDQVAVLNEQIETWKNRLEEIASLPEAASFPMVRLVRQYAIQFDEKMIIVALMNRTIRERDQSETVFSCSGGQLSVLDLSKYLAKEQEALPACLRYFSETSVLVHAGIVGSEERPWASDTVYEKRLGLDGELAGYLIGAEGEKTELEFAELCARMKDRSQAEAETREPRFSLEDVVMPAVNKARLISALEQIKSHHLIFREWGFDQKIKYGSGLAMLFAGPPGTGKTLAAEAVAGFLGKKLLVADYSKLQNKYVGETEKNIAAVFRLARQKQAVLLFDEADSVFMDRATARANWEVREVNMLLQQIESFPGVVILTSNRHYTFDPALERRLVLRLEFSSPDYHARLELWKRHIPDKAPMSSDVDYDVLAQNYVLTGAQIKNVILGAARKAAAKISQKGSQDVLITHGDILDAISEERALCWTGSAKGKMGF